MATFAEFFAGVGLVHEALAENGWECLWANDICKNKRETYVANFGDANFHLGDIWDVAKTPEIIPDGCFLYTASFPCTDLSLAGDRKGLAGAQSGTLNAVLDILKSKQLSGAHPYLVMLENVQGFLTSHRGADVAYTVQSLNELGYTVDLLELDAVHFTPQSRPRVFLFAVRDEIAAKVMALKNQADFFDPWWQVFDSTPQLRTEKIRKIIQQYSQLKWGAFKISPPPKRKNTLQDIVEQELNNRPSAWWSADRTAYLFAQMSELHQQVLQQMMRKDVFSYGTVFRRTREGKGRAELRTDGVAGCLRTPRGGSSKQILVRAGFGNWAARLLTPKEYARLQGVGEHFALPANDNQGYFAMGDAVCVPAVKYLSDKIITPTYQKVFQPKTI